MIHDWVKNFRFQVNPLLSIFSNFFVILIIHNQEDSYAYSNQEVLVMIRTRVQDSPVKDQLLLNKGLPKITTENKHIDLKQIIC